MPKKILNRQGRNGLPAHAKKGPRGRGWRSVVPRNVYEVSREYEIFELARSGMNCVEISGYLRHRGITVSPRTASEVIKTTLENIRTNNLQLLEEVREMTISALDKQLHNATKIANGKGKAPIRLQAIDRVIKIQEQRARLLGIFQEPEKRIREQREVVVRIYDGLEGPPPEELQMQPVNELEYVPEPLQLPPGSEDEVLEDPEFIK